MRFEVQDADELTEDVDERIGRKDTTTIYNTPVRSRLDDTWSQVTWPDVTSRALLARVEGEGREGWKCGNLLFDLEVLVGRVLVAIDLHVGYVSLFGGRGDGSGLLHLHE